MISTKKITTELLYIIIQKIPDTVLYLKAGEEQWRTIKQE